MAVKTFRKEVEKCLPFLEKSQEELVRAIMAGRIDYWNFALAEKLREGKIAPSVIKDSDELAFKWADEVGVWGALIWGRTPDSGGPLSSWADLSRMEEQGYTLREARTDYPDKYHEKYFGGPENDGVPDNILFLGCHYNYTPVYAAAGVSLYTGLPETPVFWHAQDPDAPIYAAIRAVELL